MIYLEIIGEEKLYIYIYIFKKLQMFSFTCSIVIKEGLDGSDEEFEL